MEIGDLAGKAGELLGEHADKIETAVDKVGELTKEKVGHEEQIDVGVEKLKDLIPGGDAEQA